MASRRGSSIDALITEARAGYRRLSPHEAFEATRTGAVLVDTRCGEALAADGQIPGARHVPLSVLPWRFDPESPHRDPELAVQDLEVILLCAHGYSSSLAVGWLRSLGLERVTDVVGGFEAWREAGLPVRR